MIFNFKKYIFPLFFFVLFLIPWFVWFEPCKIISGADFGYFGLDVSESLKKSFFSWNKNEFGFDQSSSFSFFPFSIFIFLIKKIFFLSEINLEKTIFSLLFIFPGISMYFLTKSFFKKKISIFLAILLYTFNFYHLFLWHGLILGIVIVYGFLPLFLKFFIEGLNKQKLKYSFLLAFFSIFLCASGANPPTILGIIVLPLLIYFFWYLFFPDRHREKEKKKIFFAFKFLFCLIIFFVLFNLWWILPLFYSLNNLDSQPAILEKVTILEKESEHLSFLNTFRQLGYWSLYKTDPKFDFTPFDVSSSYIGTGLKIGLLGFLLPIFAFLALFKKKLKTEKKKFILFFSLLALISLFFSKGLYSPLGNFYQWLYENISGFWIFRAPYSKLLPGYVISTALLCAFFFEEFFKSKILDSHWSLPSTAIKGKNDRDVSDDHRRNDKQKQTNFFFFCYFLIIICILIFSFPLLNGQVIEKYHKISPEKKEYQEAKDWFNQQKDDFKILILPEQLGCYGNYFWGYNGAEFVYNFLPRSGGLYGTNVVNTNQLIEKIHQIIEQQRDNPIVDEKFVELINQMGVKYIVQRNDYDYSAHLKYGYRFSSPEEIKRFLSLQKGIMFEKSFGQWDIYRIVETQDLISIVETQNLASLQNDRKISIDYKKINPTKYKIQIKDLTEKNDLIFLESYSPDWKAYLEKPKTKNQKPKFYETWFKKSIPENKHFIANGFANGWKININEVCKNENYKVIKSGKNSNGFCVLNPDGTYDLEIILEYRPQRLFYLGLFVSDLTLLICLFYLGKTYIVKKKVARDLS